MSVSVRGGGRVGWSRSTWPFATLAVTKRQLTLSVWPWGTFHFAPSDVHAIERGMLSGVVIKHTHPDYPRHLEFYGFGGADRLIDEIHRTGFRGTATAGDFAAMPEKTTAWRGPALIVVLLIWQLAAAFDVQSGPAGAEKPDGLFIAVLALSFAVATLTPYSRTLQTLLLRPGRAASEVRAHLLFAQVMSAALAAALLLMP